MLDKKREKHLTVNKGTRRRFVELCVSLATTEKENYETIFLNALKQGDFKTDFGAQSAFGFFGKFIPPLVENVVTLASLVSSGKDFSIITNQAQGFGVSNGVVVVGLGEMGIIEYSKGAWGDRREVIKKIVRNDLVDIFFEILPFFYHQPEEGGPKMIPIRQCPECGQPFFSRRWDQQFCRLKHGQRWRSREKQKKSSEV